MTKALLVSLLAACASPQHPAPSPTPKPTASPPAPAPAPPPKPELGVWSSFTDFSGHGMKGQGRFYRHDAGRWVSAWCQTNHIADPEAGPQPAPTTCGAWSPVPDTQYPTLDGLLRPGYNEIDIKCSERAELCKVLDIPIESD